MDLLHGHDNLNDTNDEDEVMEADNVVNHFPPSRIMTVEETY